ncbi:MAG: beta-galactosidase trimerization domain-containing protein, partial [Anaerolineae bacterium]|nr:beta-galactosidase trimerization domain-containing protein [Anaerolineae bacterium]
SYGLTWVACRKGDEPWKQFHAVDLTRAASRGKRFWHAEAQGGPLWMQPQVIGRPREDGRIPSAEDLRYWHLVSFMCGATGLLYPRWRPLLDGPLWGAFGPYALDGSRTKRSRMSSRLARWTQAPEQAVLWKARPVRGEVGILCVPETQLFAYAQQGHSDHCAGSLQGAYRGFYDLNVQADWVHVDDLQDYDTAYLAYPAMLTQATAERLIAWVAGGGTLISEGCPGYFGDGGHVGARQPNLGLDDLFGAREREVEFTPDLLGDLTFSLDGATAYGGLFRQSYEATSGEPVGWYADGQVAAVENRYGQGRTLLIGTMAGWGYGEHAPAGAELIARPSGLYARLLSWARVRPHVQCGDPRIAARLHASASGVYLWVANPTRQRLKARLTLGEAWGPFNACQALWGEAGQVEGRVVRVEIQGRDVAVLALS